MNQAEKLKDTLNLPQTDFPMRANAVEREPERLKHWDSVGAYIRMQSKNSGKEAFVLHDGPPFTNGDVHVGTALNKILKDTILRYKNSRGYRTPYFPGWDCHGLPIEHKVTNNLRKEKVDFDALAIRQACAEFSESFITTQRRQFQRLGVLADWEKEYRTKNPKYEAEILRTFSKFVEKDLIYRSKKPVYWSIPCKTALAEAEIEYQDHVSPSIFVRFRIIGFERESYVIIWTTTPWTLPANLAVAVHPREKYQELKVGELSYWVGSSLAQSVIEACQMKDVVRGKEITGEELVGTKTQHPFIDRESPILPADYVTMDAGTGCVHTAPGHGLDDYHTGIANGMEIYCPLDDNGCYLDDGQMPESLVGVSVLEKASGCPANHEVLAILGENGSLLANHEHNHQYPHCWRSKTPVVLRAMDQWFVALDKNGLRERSMEEVSEVSFTPDWGQNRIKGFLESRPDWCISRQRAWGVPIPVFYDENDEPFLDPDLILFIAQKMEKHGSDCWFSMAEDELLSGFELPSVWKGKILKKGIDTLDVWIDSGCSHRAVLRSEKEHNWPADLYLEGSDQHRGWFQSSLWTAMVAYGHAPYRRILTHGFVVDGEGRKISKSNGKPQTADSFVNRYGADVLRLWVCSEDFRRDIPLSDEILSQVVRSYRTLRNTIRFQLGTLDDFSWEDNHVEISEMDIIDQWALAKSDQLIDEVTKAFDSYEFHKVVQLINRYCSGVLSSTYHDIIKDRLYTLHPNDQKRRSTQTGVHIIFETLIRLIGPIMPFTADEAWSYHKSGKSSCADLLCLEDWPTLHTEESGYEFVKDAELLLELKETKINEALESLRADKKIGQSLDAEIEIGIAVDDPLFEVTSRHSDALPELFIVSSVKIKKLELGSPISITASHARGVRCPRSWRWVPALIKVKPWGEVSPRCAEVLAKL